MPKYRPIENRKCLEFGPFGPRNLREVYGYVQQHPDILLATKDKWLGALLMMARLHAAYKNEPELEILARIPCNLPLLRKDLERRFAKRKKYSDGAWGNMQTGVLQAAHAAGVKVRLGRRRVPLPLDLQALFDLLEELVGRVLYPFFRWVDEEGLTAADITQTVFDRYEAYLSEFDGRKNCRACYTGVVRAWEQARNTVAGWPAVTISIVPRHDRFCLDWSMFDPRLPQEIKRMMDAAMHPDPAFPRRRKRINAITAKHQTEQLRRLASALVLATGCDPKSITSVQQLVNPTAARTALRFLTARAYQRQLARVRQDNQQ